MGSSLGGVSPEVWMQEGFMCFLRCLQPVLDVKPMPAQGQVMSRANPRRDCRLGATSAWL